MSRHHKHFLTIHAVIFKSRGYVLIGRSKIVASFYANGRIVKAYDKRLTEAHAIVTSSTGEAS